MRRGDCSRHLGNLALMLARIVSMTPTHSFSPTEAAQLCLAAEAGVRFMPLLARLQARWQHEAAEQLAASEQAGAASTLAVALTGLWEHAWEVAQHFAEQRNAAVLAGPLLRLHSAGCRMVHASAALTEGDERAQPPAVNWCSAYNSHAQVAKLALLASTLAAASLETEADRDASFRWGCWTSASTVWVRRQSCPRRRPAAQATPLAHASVGMCHVLTVADPLLWPAVLCF